MHFSLIKSLVVFTVISAVGVRPWPEFPWARYLAGDEGGSAEVVQARAVNGGKKVKIPKAEVSVTTVKAPEYTMQMYTHILVTFTAAAYRNTSS